jgi:RimJ/RimL family protein N-acetyltransferase
MKQPNYIFESSRLGFRVWEESDLGAFSRMNADEDVMRFFPSVQTREQSRAFIERVQNHQQTHGFCYFVVDELTSGDFIGFIGASHQDFEAPFTPCVDLGWRLLPEFWGKGYAQEGANAVLVFLEKFDLNAVYAVAPSANVPSIKVMERIGMTRRGEFRHPALVDSPDLVDCVYYSKALIE